MRATVLLVLAFAGASCALRIPSLLSPQSVLNAGSSILGNLPGVKPHADDSSSSDSSSSPEENQNTAGIAQELAERLVEDVVNAAGGIGSIALLPLKVGPALFNTIAGEISNVLNNVLHPENFPPNAPTVPELAVDLAKSVVHDIEGAAQDLFKLLLEPVQFKTKLVATVAHGIEQWLKDTQNQLSGQSSEEHRPRPSGSDHHSSHRPKPTHPEGPKPNPPHQSSAEQPKPTHPEGPKPAPPHQSSAEQPKPTHPEGPKPNPPHQSSAEHPKPTHPEGPKPNPPHQSSAEHPKPTHPEGPKPNPPHQSSAEHPKPTHPEGPKPNPPHQSSAEHPKPTHPEGPKPSPPHESSAEQPKPTHPEGPKPSPPHQSSAEQPKLTHPEGPKQTPSAGPSSPQARPVPTGSKNASVQVHARVARDADISISGSINFDQLLSDSKVRNLEKALASVDFSQIVKPIPRIPDLTPLGELVLPGLAGITRRARNLVIHAIAPGASTVEEAVQTALNLAVHSVNPAAAVANLVNIILQVYFFVAQSALVIPPVAAALLKEAAVVAGNLVSSLLYVLSENVADGVRALLN